MHNLLKMKDPLMLMGKRVNFMKRCLEYESEVAELDDELRGLEARAKVKRAKLDEAPVRRAASA